jgi:hypothetical protein
VIKALDFLYSVVVIGVSVSVIVIVSWFVIGMVIAFWKVYVRGPIGSKVPKKLKRCKHSNSTYAEKHPDLVWECNDCGELHK